MKSSKLKKHIIPLHMNGLDGRMLRLPAPKNKKRQILLLYGHHASLERMFGIAEVLNRYGAVTLPDLPGFGGMESFYKLKEKPTLDNFADYLAAFIKLEYKNRRVTIIAMSFSFLVVTRMLQRYPELAKKVDMNVSFVGFLHRDDFNNKPFIYWSVRIVARLFSGRVRAYLGRKLILQPWNIKFAYGLVSNRHGKLKDAAAAERKRRIQFEIKLWQINDVRTRMETMTAMMTADLCDRKVDLPVYHVSVTDDFYFNHAIIEQHMLIVYKDFENIPCQIAAHAPTILADAKAAAPFVPPRLRKLLAAK